MTKLHKIELWAVLALSGLLLALSMAGSFLGVARAAALFNSWPLVIFWFLFDFLLIAGLGTFEQLRQRPGSLLMHLAALVILGGAMWGSTRGHEAANNLLGEKKVPSGFVQISEGETNNIITSDAGMPLGHLPFSLALEKFEIEYYPAPEENWLLVLELPRSPTSAKPMGMGEDEEGPIKQIRIPWKVGEDVTVAEKPDLHFKVLQYLPAARPVYDKEARPSLVIFTASNVHTVLPGKVGEKAEIAEPKVGVEIVQVFSNLMVQGMSNVVDAGGEPENPALKVQLTWPDGKDGRKEIRYIMSKNPMHGQKDDGLHLSYDFPEPIGAEADAKSTTPAMEVLMTHGDKQQKQWFVPGEKSEESAWITLGPLLGQQEQQSSVPSPQSSGAAKEETKEETKTASPSSAGGFNGNGNNNSNNKNNNTGDIYVAPTTEENNNSMVHPPFVPDIALVKPQGETKSYTSHVAVVSEGTPIAERDIQVNNPMHYGGYHFYQSSYGLDPGTGKSLYGSGDHVRFGVAGGLFRVFLLIAGTVWHCWLRPAWAYVAGRRTDGD